MLRPPRLLVSCRYWALKPALLTLLASLPILVLPAMPPPGSAILVFYVAAAILTYLASNSSLASLATLSILLYRLWTWPLEAIPPELFIVAAGLTALISFLLNLRRGPYGDPSLESIARWPTPSLSPLALATATFSLPYASGFGSPIQGGLTIHASLSAASAVLASLTPIPIPLKLLLGALSGLGPVGLLASALAASFHPYCYKCTLADSENRVRPLLVIARTWRSRGVDRLEDGRIVSCASGFGHALECYHLEDLSGLDSWIIRSLARKGSIEACRGCGGEIVLSVR